jgi:hypothetical protein
MRHYIKIETLMREKKPINKGFLRCEVRLVRALDASPVDPFQQHRELRGAQAHCPMRRLRPHETPAFKTLGEEAQPIAAPPQAPRRIVRSLATARVTGLTQLVVLVELFGLIVLFTVDRPYNWLGALFILCGQYLQRFERSRLRKRGEAALCRCYGHSQFP